MPGMEFWDKHKNQKLQYVYCRTQRRWLVSLTATGPTAKIANTWTPCFEMCTRLCLKAISRLPALTTLRMKRCDGVSGEGFIHLSAFTSLRELDVSGCCNLNDAGLKAISRLPALINLHMKRCDGVLCAGFDQPSAFTSLQYLDVSGCYNLNDAGVEAISRLPALTNLDMWGCRGVSGAGFRHLSALTYFNYSYEDLKSSFWDDFFI